jgi:hypothetical protein
MTDKVLLKKSGMLFQKGEYAEAYEVLTNPKLESSSRAKALKLYYNYFEYVNEINRIDAIEQLKLLSDSGDYDATYILMLCFMIPGQFKSYQEAEPELLILAKRLYENGHKEGTAIYAAHIVQAKKYNEGWKLLNDTEGVQENIQSFKVKYQIIKESEDHRHLEDDFFYDVKKQYDSGNLSVAAIYLKYLLNQENSHFNVELGLEILRLRVDDKDAECIIIYAFLLMSNEWYLKRDPILATKLLTSLVFQNPHNYDAQKVLANFYTSADFRDKQNLRPAVSLLEPQVWYGDDQSLKLIISICNELKEPDHPIMYKAMKRLSELKGKKISFIFIFSLVSISRTIFKVIRWFFLGVVIILISPFKLVSYFITR